MELESLTDGLNQAQRNAVTSDASPLCILAGAGTGKTRVLTRRIAHRSASGAIDASHVLALTFTRKAASELRHRLRALGLNDEVAAGTFHATAMAQLRSRWADRGIRPPELLDRKFGLVARAAGQADRAVVADLLGEIEWAKARRISADDYPSAVGRHDRHPPVAPAEVARIYTRYEDEKRRRRMVDFDDLLMLCIRDLEADADYAAGRRWIHRHLFVDEFQDVNPLQYRLLELWLGDRDDLCVVGDPNQAIYTWNGADVSYLTKFTERWPGADVARLDQNYRSTPQILGAANALIRGRGSLLANRPDGPPVSVDEHADDRAEASAIAQQLVESRNGGRGWSTMAVLVRTNGQVPILQEALRTSDIPTRIRGRNVFLARPEVAQILSELEHTDTSLARALVDVGLEARQLDGVESPELVAKRDALETLVRLGRDHLALEPGSTGRAFSAWVRSTIGTDDVDAAIDAVELATFHAAKGLEWPVVHLAGLEMGLVPIGHADTDAAKAEERRLFYVACTRAQTELHLHWAATRTFGERTRSRTRSVYVDWIFEATGGDGGSARTTRRDLAKKAASTRRSLDRRRTPAEPLAVPIDDPLFVALRAWRSETARSAGVPAYVVFHDRTLAEVAARRPSSLAELAQVSGLGPVKVSRYGDRLLELVGDH